MPPTFRLGSPLDSAQHIDGDWLPMWPSQAPDPIVSQAQPTVNPMIPSQSALSPTGRCDPSGIHPTISAHPNPSQIHNYDQTQACRSDPVQDGDHDGTEGIPIVSVNQVPGLTRGHDPAGNNLAQSPRCVRRSSRRRDAIVEVRVDSCDAVDEPVGDYRIDPTKRFRMSRRRPMQSGEGGGIGNASQAQRHVLNVVSANQTVMKKRKSSVHCNEQRNAGRDRRRTRLSSGLGGADNLTT